MKTQTITLFLALIFLTPALSQAQFGNLLNRAAKALNSSSKAAAKGAIDSTALKNGTPSANDSISKLNQGKQAQNQSGQLPGGINFANMFGKVDLKHKDEYSFTSRLYMVVETYNKKESMKMDLYMYFSGNTPIVGMESKSYTDEKGKTVTINSSTVMDGENKSFIILTEANGNKMGLISAIPDEQHPAPAKPDGKPSQKTSHPNFTKTGNSRVIAGYNCDEYSYTDSENKLKGSVWFTKDATLNIDKRGWQKTGMGAYYGYEGFEGGIIMATEGYDENGKLTMKSETKEIKSNFDHSISLKGYTLTQMNLGQR